MALWHAGVQRRFSVDTLTPQGDEQGHGETKTGAYKGLIARLTVPEVSEAGFVSESDWTDVVEILDWARTAGIRVVGGCRLLWMRQASRPMSSPFCATCIAVMGNASWRYPTGAAIRDSYFYDSLYHLSEAHQIAHSELLAPYLAEIAKTGRCPAP